MGRISLEQIEWALIQGIWPWDPCSNGPLTFTLAQNTIEGNFRHVLTSSFSKTILTSSDGHETLMDFQTVSSHEDEISLLCVGISLLHAFIQLNWTGPNLDLSPSTLIADFESSSDTLNQRAIVELAYGGEPAYHLAHSPIFLRWAISIFNYPFKHAHSALWWKLRGTIIHQYVLDEPVPLPPSFFAELEPLISYLAKQGAKYPDLLGRLILERGLLHHLFSNDRLAAEHFIRAARGLNLQYELTGALGKRTKFQETDLSQLVLLAESRNREGEVEPGTNSSSDIQPSHATISPPPSAHVPETLALNDDTLLEQTVFTSSQPHSSSILSHLSPGSQPALHPLDQCVLLAMCLNIKNTSPSHGLTSEQMSAYVARVLSDPRNWSVHTMALLLRSRLEASRTRTVERAVLQLQALVDQMPTADSTLKERLLYVHDIPLPSKWQMERELALRFFSLGVVKSALEIFERLEMWEEVVKCWQALERPEKGIAIVRDLLEGKREESDQVLSKGKSTRQNQNEDIAREAKLWCLLGDLEPEKARDHYERAWVVSKETSGRAMRSLGGYHFARNEFKEAMTCLRLAAKIHPMLSRTWFILGCAAMREEAYEDAREAFARCVAIDDEDGESWNNLATVYLRMGAAGKEVVDDSNDKTREPGSSTADEKDPAHADTSSEAKTILFSNKMLAFRALHQGLKYSYENWRMWSNYMVVAVDVGELAEACRALTRIVEERADKDGAACVDDEVLARLVNAVTRVPFEQPSPQSQAAEDDPIPPSKTPNEGHGLLPRVLDLFERTILPRVSSPRISHRYARLLTWQKRWTDALKAYLDAFRTGLAGQMTRGETDVQKWREAVEEVSEIVDVLRNFGPRAEGSTRWLFQARSIVRSFMGKTKDSFEDEPEWQKLVTLQRELQDEE